MLINCLGDAPDDLMVKLKQSLGKHIKGSAFTYRQVRATARAAQTAAVSRSRIPGAYSYS